MIHLIDQQVVDEKMLAEAAFAYTHQVSGVPYHLGAGILYYALAYMIPAKLCVCLGSGGGYVPRLMRQGQIDARITEPSHTVLVDAALAEAGWGGPDYYARQHCLFRREWDVELVRKRTDEACKMFTPGSIDYLHIDADHSLEGALGDWNTWTPLVREDGVVTIHDTNYQCGVPELIALIIGTRRWGVVNFPAVGTGTAILKRIPE